MFCTNCGNTLRDSSFTFCTTCGAKVEAVSQQPASDIQNQNDIAVEVLAAVEAVVADAPTQIPQETLFIDPALAFCTFCGVKRTDPNAAFCTSCGVLFAPAGDNRQIQAEPLPAGPYAAVEERPVAEPPKVEPVEAAPVEVKPIMRQPVFSSAPGFCDGCGEQFIHDNAAFCTHCGMQYGAIIIKTEGAGPMAPGQPKRYYADPFTDVRIEIPAWLSQFTARS